MIEIRCPKCNAPNQIKYESKYFSCKYCNNTFIFDIEGMNKTFTYKKKLNDKSALQYLKKDFINKGLNILFEVKSINLTYIPFFILNTSKLYSGFSNFPEETIDMFSEEKLFFNAYEVEKNTKIYDIDTQPNTEIKTRDIIYIPFFEVEIIFNNKEYKYYVNGLNGLVYGKTIEYIDNKETRPYLFYFTLALMLFIIINSFIDPFFLALSFNLITLYIFYNITTYLINKKDYKKK